MSILWNPAEATVVEKVSLPVITTGTQNMGDGIYWLKAGTPLDEDLAVSNDGDAVYIVAEDFFFISTNPNQDRRVPLIKAGYVDLNKAEAAAGITYADAAVAALKEAGIEVVDGLLETGGGGSGGGVVTAKVTYSSGSYTADVSYADLRAAYEAGSEVQLEYINSIYKLSYANASALDFAYITVMNDAYALQQAFSYSSGSLTFSSAEVSGPTEPMTYSATLGSGTYTLDSDAGSISSNFNFPIPCYIYLTDGDDVNYNCPIVGAKETPGDDDSSYAFYIVLNGSIVAFTAASGSDFPTYTP